LPNYLKSIFVDGYGGSAGVKVPKDGGGIYYLFFTSIINKVGTIKRVKNDDRISPKITALPSAIHTSLDKVTGIIPKIVQIDVMKIASSLDFPASITAS
jgi:hypothetical protein